MKKLLLSLFFVSIITAAKADGEYPFLTFESSDGSVTSIVVLRTSNIDETTGSSSELVPLELTVSDGTLVATNEDGNVVFTLSDLTKMYFSLKDETSIVDGIDIISSLPVDNTAEVYTLSGIRLGKFKDIESAKSVLTSGVYIINTNNHKIKISIK